MAEFSVDLPQPKATYVRLKRHLIPTVSPYISLLVSPIQRVFSQMGRPVPVVVYVVAMAAVIVSVDFVLFRNRFWERTDSECWHRPGLRGLLLEIFSGVLDRLGTR